MAPVADTVKVAVLPALTVTLAGWLVITGALGVVPVGRTRRAASPKITQDFTVWTEEESWDSPIIRLKAFITMEPTVAFP
ncbi:MAG: hypothetical protein BWY56_01759 [Acidobacteria bacterium ADurb.Bin340]|nr:MAG: hypothetical protein BWY56_01759 [Acidobacteria bacterium ADurb.Bin340]